MYSGRAYAAQLLNYLRATPYEVGLLLNFGPKAEFRRKAFDNDLKPSITWEYVACENENKLP